MMITRNSLFAAAVACAAFYMTAAQAQLGRPLDGRPVSTKDLAGKKICWDNGHIGMFAANGQFTNDRGDETSWQVTEPGVVQVGLTYREYKVLSDGSFYMHWYKGKSITGHHELWGKVCN